MDWPATISQLLGNGWTQKRLADKCGCAQATISDLARGKTSHPSYPVGKELERISIEEPIPAPEPATTSS